MTYQVLARKWRPKNFDQVVGQSAIVRSLKNAIKNHTFSQAYLLTGTRGIGKTSVARIMAKALRCEQAAVTGNPCMQCDACIELEQEQSFNVMEIDGASNNSVDNIRELIDNVQYLPTSGKYKIYIIDEVHMLSPSAFNALLKTLEEPPAHVVFIFATTEPHKVLDTILSRCQRFDFQNADVATLVLHLENVALEEKIQFESKSTIHKIAILADGSFRDALSYLDQVLIYSENRYISDQVILEALGMPGELEMSKLFRGILEANYGEVKNICQMFFQRNVKVKSIVRDLLDLAFDAIENIDTLNKHLLFKQVSPVVLKNLSLAELVWIYETLNKDAEWVMNSLSCNQAFLVCLKKITLRHTFFTKTILKKATDIATDHEEILEAAKVEVETKETMIEPVVEPAAETAKIKVESVVEKNKTWDGFLTFLGDLSPAQAANLEQGNLLMPLNFSDDKLVVELGFNQTEEVFFEYLQEPASRNKLIAKLSEFFSINEELVHLNLKLVNSEEREEINFRSQRDIADEEEGHKTELKREQFLQDQRIREMEQIFGSKVDRVIIQE